jgi:hypothetical protein
LADDHMSVPTDNGANAGLKVASPVAGMVPGADNIDNMALPDILKFVANLERKHSNVTNLAHLAGPLSASKTRTLRRSSRLSASHKEPASSVHRREPTSTHSTSDTLGSDPEQRECLPYPTVERNINFDRGRR